MRNRIEQALQQMPASFAPYLRELVLAKDFDATFSAEQYQQLLTLSGLEDADLRVALLPIAAAYSYAPISEFLCRCDCTWHLRPPLSGCQYGIYWCAAWANRTC